MSSEVPARNEVSDQTADLDSGNGLKRRLAVHLPVAIRRWASFCNAAAA
jgi:hypothetical protein